MYNSFVLIVVLTMTIALSSCYGGMIIDNIIEEQKCLEQHYIFSEIITEPDLLAPIKSIALLNIPNPHCYLPYYLDAEPTIVGKDTRKYEGFNFSVITQQHLIELLEAKGYHVILFSVNRDNPHKLLDDYSHLNIPDVDAFLDLAPVKVGFNMSPWTHESLVYGPYVSLVVRLVSADSKKILYAESVQYGYGKNYFIEGSKIDAPLDDNFEDTDPLISQNEKAVEQLVRGIDAISRSIADRFSR